MSEHTKEPWNADVSITDKNGWELPKQIVTISSGEKLIARYSTDYGEFPCDSENEANARRIVACVNACEGIPTETLVIVGTESVKAKAHSNRSFNEVVRQRDKLLAALKVAMLILGHPDDKVTQELQTIVSKVEKAK